MPRRINTVRTEIDADTGEVINVTTRTAEQIAAFQKKMQTVADYEARGYCIRKQSDELGGFTWLIYNTGEVLDLGLKSDELTKVIFLSTYMDYDNYLSTGNVTKKGERLTKSNVFYLLNIKKTKFAEFWRSVKKCGILVEQPETGWVKLSDEVFHKGSVSGIDVSKSTIRIYANAVRELYNKSTPNEHKLLSYVYQAIPFVNVRYNTLCTNPDEEELSLIKRLTLADYCALIGYDVNNKRRLKGMLKNLTVRTESVFGFVEAGSKDSIFINPRVYYGGNNYDEVKVLGKFCENGGECERQ